MIANITQKVLSKEMDRTTLLQSLGVPLTPYSTKTNQYLDNLPHEKKGGKGVKYKIGIG